VSHKYKIINIGTNLLLLCHSIGERKHRVAWPQAIQESTSVDCVKGGTGVLRVRNDLVVRYSINNGYLDSGSISQPNLPEITLQIHAAGLQSVEQQVTNWMLHWLHKAQVGDPIRKTLIQLEHAFSAPKTLYPLPADYLLTLVHYNVLRAFVSNTLCLGLDPKRICFELMSPFTSSSPKTPRQLPPALHPTSLQQTRSHHPFIDIFPSSTARDNLLRAAEDSFDIDELWRDFFGTRFLRGNVGVKENLGMVVWGEPWSVQSWEVTEGCWRKWRWALMGCWELLEATNFWRKKRGEVALEIMI
jgi:hypothetical protein